MSSSSTAAKSKGCVIKIITSDNKEFSVHAKVIMFHSKLINEMLEDADVSETSTDEHTIPLPNAQSHNFEKFLKYVNHFFDTAPTEYPRPVGGKRFDKLQSDFEKHWLATIKDNDEMSDMIMLANYLDAKYLFEMLTSKVAFDLEGKTSEQMAAILGVTCDLTEEQKQQIEIEKKWLEQQ